MVCITNFSLASSTRSGHHLKYPQQFHYNRQYKPPNDSSRSDLTMRSSEEPQTTVINNSSISFVLMGPSAAHRRVIARSNHDNLDLVGLDHPAMAEVSQLRPANPITAIFARNRVQDLVVYSPETFSVMYGGDIRKTHLTFAWKGRANETQIRSVERAFEAMAPDILEATIADSKAALEWQLAGLILLCSTLSARARERDRIMAAAMLAFAALYFGLFATSFYPRIVEAVRELFRII